MMLSTVQNPASNNLQPTKIDPSAVELRLSARPASSVPVHSANETPEMAPIQVRALTRVWRCSPESLFGVVWTNCY